MCLASVPFTSMFGPPENSVWTAVFLNANNCGSDGATFKSTNCMFGSMHYLMPCTVIEM